MKIHDLHCHILPGLDDGPYSLEESLQMAFMAAENNTAGLVCTPHYFPVNSYSRQELFTCYRDFYAAVHDSNIPLHLALGQEIFLDHAFLRTADMLESGELLTLNRSVYPLVEVDPQISAVFACRMLDALIARGFKPILAHPERYAFICENPSILIHMHAEGILLQLNKDSLFGNFGVSAQQTAHFMLKNRLASFVSSDAHSPYQRNPQLLTIHEIISEQYSEEYADILFTENPLCILRNQEVFHY